MSKIRISAVKYANTYPFIYGLTVGGFCKKVILETDHPSECASKLISGKVDIGLIPVAAIPQIDDPYVISDYCIGANGEVKTVMLLSNCHIDNTDTIYLDYRSQTSINLIKVLAKYFWKRKFKWIDTSSIFNFLTIGSNEAVVLIGDQCFEFEKKFRFKMDMASEWKRFTGLPVVFACWTANKKLENKFIEEFNNVLGSGVNNLDAVAERFGNTGVIKGKALKEYMSDNIDYYLDDEKRRSMKLFLELMSSL